MHQLLKARRVLTLSDYQGILKNAVPTIRNRISQVGNLDMRTVSKPNRKIDLGDI